MNRNLSWVILIFIALALAACLPFPGMSASGFIESVPVSPTDAVPSGDRATVALLLNTLSNPFVKSIEIGARQAADEFGVQVVVKAAAQETSVEQQIALLQNLDNDEVDAVIITPTDSTRLIPALKEVRDAGIALINIDNRLDPGLAWQSGLGVVPYIGPDDQQDAYLAAKELAAWVDKPTHAAIISGPSQSPASEAREKGARLAFKENPLIKTVVTRAGDWKIEQAYQAAQEIFTTDPQVTLVFSANDLMALGVVQYLQDTGRANVLVGGLGGLAEARQAILAGKMVVTVDQQAEKQGYLGVQYAIMALQDKVLPGVTPVQAQVITEEDLRK